MNDVAIFLDIIAPYFQVYFTAIVCVAGVCRVGRIILMEVTQVAIDPCQYSRFCFRYLQIIVSLLLDAVLTVLKL